MRMLLTASLFGSFLVAMTSMLVPSSAEAGSCRGWRGRVFPNCAALRVPNGVPDASVPEPGAAALFALGAGLIAARSRRPR